MHVIYMASANRRLRHNISDSAASKPRETGVRSPYQGWGHGGNVVHAGFRSCSLGCPPWCLLTLPSPSPHTPSLFLRGGFAPSFSHTRSEGAPCPPHVVAGESSLSGAVPAESGREPAVSPLPRRSVRRNAGTPLSPHPSLPLPISPGGAGGRARWDHPAGPGRRSTEPGALLGLPVPLPCALPLLLPALRPASSPGISSPRQ